MAFPRAHGSLADEFGDYEPLFARRPTYNSHDVCSSGISPEDQQVLESAFFSNSHPSAGDINHLTYTHLDAGTYHLSEQSDSVNAPSSLQLPGNITAQDDGLLFNSGGWVGSGHEPVADSVYFRNANSSAEFNTEEHLETHSYYTPSFSQDIDSTSSQNILREEIASNDLLKVPSAGAPWYPGSRLNQQGESVDVTYNFPGVGRFPHSVHQSSQAIDDYSPPASVSSHIPPHIAASDARGSTRSRKGHASTTSSQGETKVCDHCGALFTGRYRRGNCARHVRQRHAGNPTRPSQDCVCRVCKKNFHRQDARRKHEWKKHQLQDTKPCPRRLGAGSECDISHKGPYDTASDQGTLTATATFAVPEDTAINPRFRLPNRFQQAGNAFMDIKAKLATDDRYDLYCQQFLARCTRIVGELENAQSNLHGIFTQEVQTLSLQLMPAQSLSSTQHFRDEEYFHNAQDTPESNDGKRADSRPDRGRAPITRRTSRASSSRFDPYSGRPSKRSDAGTLVAIIKLFEDAQSQGLDCPIRKWHGMHGRPSPCNGCGKPYMNGVRQHLGPQYSQQHQGRITFIQRCSTCAEDFIDRNIWELGGHGNGACQGRSQPQGHSLVCWARLYLKIYPEETRIPSPYRNDARHLPANLVVHLRAELHLPQVMTLGNQQVPLLSFPSPTDSSTRLGSENVNRTPEQVATLDVLIAQGIVLLARFLAEEYIEAVHEPVDLTDITSSFYMRLNHLRHATRPDTTIPSRPTLHDPATGGAADFTTPAYQAQPLLPTLQIPSDMGTVPSIHSPSAFFEYPAGSSHTDYDLDLATSPFGVPAQPEPPHFYTAAPPSPCPASSGLWLSPAEAQPVDAFTWRSSYEDAGFYEDADGDVDAMV